MRITVSSSNWVTIFPKAGAHSATVVLMHGLGDSADGWRDTAEQWHSRMPWVKFIVPSAKSRPITLNGGMSMPGWYDIVGLDDRASESCEGIDDSIKQIREALEGEASLGLPYSRLMLAGFSQGGAMSLFTGLQMPAEQKLGGILILSGYCPGYSRFKLTPGLEDTPLLHCHGTADPVVLHDWAVKTREFVLGQGKKEYELKSYANLAHSASNEEMADALAFVTKCLPDDSRYNLPPPDPKTMSVKELKAAIVEAGLASQARGFTEKSEFIELLVEHQQS